MVMMWDGVVLKPVTMTVDVKICGENTRSCRLGLERVWLGGGRWCSILAASLSGGLLTVGS